MKTIWKFGVPFSEDAKVEMPEGARIVYFAVQDRASDHAQIWAEVSGVTTTKPRHLSIHGTGHPIPDDSVYIASCLDGPFVWHLYERSAA